MHGNYVLLATVFTSRDQRTRDTAGRRASTVKVRRHACTQSLVLTCVPHITFSRSRAGRCMSARRLLRPLCHCIVHGCCLRAPGSSCGPALCLSLCLPRARACVMRGQMASIVLGIGPGRASPAQAHRASCQTGSGQESPNIFWAVPCQPEV
jgi:hypothetical protein